MPAAAAWAAAAVALLLLAAIVSRLVLRPIAGLRTTLRTAATSGSPGRAGTGPEATVAPTPSATRLAPAVPAPASAAVPLSGTPLAPGWAGPPSLADSAPPDARRLGLEVASFIVPERAQAERKRLAGTGHPVRVLAGWENGATVYRVVLGSFPSRSAAEHSADELLAAGIVEQARVVALPERQDQGRR